MVLWLATAALAGSESWVLAESTWFIDEPLEISKPLSQWSFSGGYVFRIEEKGVAVGVVVVGDGTWTVSFATPREALVTANRLAVLEGVDPAELSDLYEAGLPLETDRGMFMSHEAWGVFAPHLLEVGDRGVVLDGEIEEVLVTGYRGPKAARRLALRVLEDRTQWLRSNRFDPASLLQVERWQPSATPVWMAEFQTKQSWDRFAGAVVAGASERWLSHVRDPAGILDSRASDTVFTMHRDECCARIRPLTRVLFPPNQRGDRGPRNGIDVAAAKATHLFVPDAAASALTAHSAVELELVARGGPAEVAWIDIPHMYQQPWASEPPLPNGWELTKIEANGEPLEALHVPMTPDQVEGRGWHRTYAVRIPTLEPGESLSVLLEYQDVHRYAHLLSVDNLGHVASIEDLESQLYDLGSATQLIRALPRIRANRAHGSPATIRIGVPAEGARRRRAVLSAAQTREWTEKPWHWVQGDTTTTAPSVAIGDWRPHNEAAANGSPAVQVALRNGGADIPHQVAVQVRQLLDLYGDVLPPYPAQRVQVVQTVANVEDLSLLSGGSGMVALGTTHARGFGISESSYRNQSPHLELYLLADALNRHWWIERGTADYTLAHSMSIAYGITAVEAIHGPEVGKTWRTTLREVADVSDGRIGPLTDRGSQVAGADIILGAMADRYSMPKVREAVDSVLRGDHPASFEGFEAALVEVCDESVHDFFDIWVHTGIAPRVGLDWSQEGGQLRVEATSNLPFGSFDIPIRVRTDGEDLDVDIVIVDGSGVLSIPVSGSVASIRVDPDQTRILRR